MCKGDRGAHRCGVVCSGERGREEGGEWEQGQDGARVDGDGECLKVLEGTGSCVVGGGERGRKVGGEREYDETVRVWDVETGQCLKVMEGHRPIEAVAMSRDGKMVIAGL